MGTAYSLTPIRKTSYCPIAWEKADLAKGETLVMRGIRARFLLAVVASLLFGWSSGVGATPVEWTIDSGGNGHWYDFIGRELAGNPNAYSWDGARLDAEARGGYLATPTSARFVAAPPTTPPAPAPHRTRTVRRQSPPAVTRPAMLDRARGQGACRGKAPR